MFKLLFLSPLLACLTFFAQAANADDRYDEAVQSTKLYASPTLDEKTHCEYYTDCVREGRSIVDEPSKPRHQLENSFSNTGKGGRKSVSDLITDQLKPSSGY